MTQSLSRHQKKMKEFNLVTWAFFLMAFLAVCKANLFSVKLEMKNISNHGMLTNHEGSAECCGKQQAINIVAKSFVLQCDRDFWTTSCNILLKNTKKIRVEEIEVTSPTDKTKRYAVHYVRSLTYLKFTYTAPKTGGVPWSLIVNTSPKSGKTVAVVYFIINCQASSKTVLANSFDNFNPGHSDVFDFIAPPAMDGDTYCVVLQPSKVDMWIMSSMILIDHTNSKNYTFYHGERTYYLQYYGYLGSDAVNWTIEVTTGEFGTDYNIELTLVNGKCSSKHTLDNEKNNFEPWGTDVFHIRAKKCNGLEKIVLRNQFYHSKWRLVKINATQEGGSSYLFYHNETLNHQQTFFVNQTSGVNEWNVSVCTQTSTHSGVYVKLHGRHGRTESIRLTTAKDDFQANQCSNFTLHLKTIGRLWMIELNKPNYLLVKTITLYNDGDTYEFQAAVPGEKQLKLVHPVMVDSLIFTPTIPNTGIIEEQCAHRCVHDLSCFQFYVNHTCVFAPVNGTGFTEYTLLHEISVWTLSLLIPTQVKTAKVTFIDAHKRRLMYTTSSPETTFSLLSSFFDAPKTVTLEIFPKGISCHAAQIYLNKTTATQLEVLKLKGDGKCSWKTQGNSKFYPRKAKVPKTTTPSELSTATPTNTESTSTESTSTESTNTESTISTLATNTESTNSTIDPNSTIGQSTVPYSTVSPTNDSITDSPNVTMCECLCPRVLSKEEEAESMKELVKELKVNRNETTSYLRSKISAPDERTSSKVIGSTIVIIMGVPFGMILLIDLTPLFSLLYKKAVSLM